MQSSNTNQKKLRQYLNVIKRAVAYVESMLDNDDGGLLEELVSSPLVKESSPIKTKFETPAQVASTPTKEQSEYHFARQKHISDLMAIDCWPEAAPAIAAKQPTKEDQINRANSVLDAMIDTDMEGFHFLDYGCADGWITQESINRGVARAVGYDIVKSQNWDQLKSVEMVTELDPVKHTNFDLVMLYDVIDHVDDAPSVMSEIKRVIKPQGRVYVRCHPWTSKHANHLFKSGLNKAFIHLFLTEKEIEKIIGKKPMQTFEGKTPLETYHQWFKDFDIKKERVHEEPVNNFFHVPAFKELLASEQNIQIDKIDEFIKLMKIQFIDFTLTPKS